VRRDLYPRLFRSPEWIGLTPRAAPPLGSLGLSVRHDMMLVRRVPPDARARPRVAPARVAP